MINPPPVAPVDTTSQRFKDAVSAYLAAMHGAQGEIIPPLYYAIKAWERDKPASGELERLRAALKAAEDKQCASCRHCDSFGLSAALKGDAP